MYVRYLFISSHFVSQSVTKKKKETQKQGINYPHSLRNDFLSNYLSKSGNNYGRCKILNFSISDDNEYRSQYWNTRSVFRSNTRLRGRFLRT
jgi:hypothetical protein